MPARRLVRGDAKLKGSEDYFPGCKALARHSSRTGMLFSHGTQYSPMGMLFSDVVRRLIQDRRSAGTGAFRVLSSVLKTRLGSAPLLFP